MWYLHFPPCLVSLSPSSCVTSPQRGGARWAAGHTVRPSSGLIGLEPSLIRLLCPVACAFNQHSLSLNKQYTNKCQASPYAHAQHTVHKLQLLTTVSEGDMIDSVPRLTVNQIVNLASFSDNTFTRWPQPTDWGCCHSADVHPSCLPTSLFYQHRICCTT